MKPLSELEKDMTNILKHDLCHGYYVRIRRDGKRYIEKFHFSDYEDSRRKALIAAQNWRDEFKREWKKLCNGKDEKIQYQRTNTGFPGISVTQREKEDCVEMKANIFNDGSPTGITRRLTSKIGSADYWVEYKAAFLELKQVINNYNRKRFGGRWYFYKQRKGIVG